MRKKLKYLLILTPIIAITALSLLAIAPHKVVAQYIVGGELEAPQITTPDNTLLIVAGASAVALIIGITVALKLRESKAE